MRKSKNHTHTQNKYYSQTWDIQVRPTVAKEFINHGLFDDNLAGLHEIRLRQQEKKKAKK